MQFEQFFSAELALELQTNPEILKGQQREITVFQTQEVGRKAREQRGTSQVLVQNVRVVSVGGKEVSASQLVEQLGFTNQRQWTPVGDLSGGERRRLQLLRLLVGEPNVLMLLAMVFLIVGFAFKVSAVPFHMWTPDAYEGAPTPATSYMAVAVKSAAFAVLLRVLVVAFGSLVAAGLPLMLTIIGLVAAAGSLYLGTAVMDISIWAMNFALMFALALGIDYALFIVYRFRGALFGSHEPVEDAVAETMDTAGKAVLLSGATVLVSLSAVMLVPSPSRRYSVGIVFTTQR